MKLTDLIQEVIAALTEKNSASTPGYFCYSAAVANCTSPCFFYGMVYNDGRIQNHKEGGCNEEKIGCRQQ